ncbi:hypothetical protein OH77DRAFT_680634 [Trametes cingulata]|nr:hypothetical protein OH77DRAFT_680634 [Trametes cingulata]
MSTFYVDRSLCYCSLCDRYFPDILTRAHHVRFSRNHPKCEKCNVRFANGNALRVHYTISRRHNYCAACDRHFRSPAGLRAHVELSAIHGGDDSDDEDEDDESIDDSYDGWEDDVGGARWPDENDPEEPPVTDDEDIADHDVYWPEDDELDFFEEQRYNGYAPVPPEFRRQTESGDTSSETSEGATATEAGASSDARKDITCVALPQEQPPPSAGTLALSCPICLESASTPTATSCGHIFCAPCVRSALRVDRSCPVCRASAHPRDLRKLFLDLAS